MSQPNLALIVVKQGGQPTTDSEVETHARFGRVLFPHPLAFFLRDHFEGELIMITEEGAPLTVVRNGGSAPENLSHIFRAAFFESHVEARHNGEMKSHVKFVPIPK